jgi:hypothetical protein
MKSPTFGAAAARLRANGYEPVSAVAPRGVYEEHLTGHHRAWQPHEISEHVAAVELTGMAVLVIAPAAIADVELLERVRAALAGATAGPCRVGSDGLEVYPLQAFGRPSGDALDGAVRLVCDGLLPLDATWRGGDLLTVPRTELPSADELPAVLETLGRLPFVLAAERRPPPAPSLEGWLE